MKIKCNMTVIIALLAGIILLPSAACDSGSRRESATEVHEEQEGHNESMAHEEQITKDEHDEHGEEKIVVLSDTEMKEYDIEVSEAQPGMLSLQIDLTGEIVVDPDRQAHVTPRVSGVAREVRKKLGEYVQTGEVLAVLESRELSEVQSAYLMAKERLELAETSFKREERLWKQSISSERVYLEAKLALAEARILLNESDQKLHALGFTDNYLSNLSFHQDVPLTRYQIAAPFEGIVIEKHITLGEALKDDAEAFLIADLNYVWVNLTVYQKDLPHIRINQHVNITSKHAGLTASGVISYISPTLSEETRAATARVVLGNPDMYWRPGLFVNAEVTVEEIEVPIIAIKEALVNMDGTTGIFVKAEEGFELEPVSIGLENGTHVEIVSGLELGQLYVSRGAFTLKSELEKASFGGEGHSH